MLICGFDAVITSKVASVTVEVGSQCLPPSTVCDSQQVTFPNHFQVSEAFKNGLTFGSFDANFGARTEIINNPVSNDKSNFVAESSQESDENVEESSSRWVVLILDCLHLILSIENCTVQCSGSLIIFFVMGIGA